MVKGPNREEGTTVHSGYVSSESPLLDTELRNVQNKTELKGGTVGKDFNILSITESDGNRSGHRRPGQHHQPHRPKLH